METAPKSTWTNEDYFKAIPAMVVGVSSMFFILGLLVVNLHLARFGIYSMEFLRAEYLLAGAVFILLMSIAGVVISHFIHWAVELKTLWAKREFLAIFTRFSGTLFRLLAIPFALVFLWGDEVISIRTMGKPLVGILFSSLMIYSAYSIAMSVLSRSHDTDENQKGTSRPHKKLSKLFMPLIAVLMGVTTYANTTYPYISAAFGGALRAPAMIFLSPRGIEVCKTLALPVNANQTIGPIEVLAESEKDMTILVQNGPSDERVAIQLSKVLFDAVQTKTNPRFRSRF